MISEDKLPQNDHVMELTTKIISSYVAKNPVSKAELSSLVTEIYSALKALSSGTSEAKAMVTGKPSVPISKSYNDKEIICLECGQSFKSIKRHLDRVHGLKPNEYRAKWGLPTDYPTVTPNYSKSRSSIAKELGLGRKKGDKVKN